MEERDSTETKVLESKSLRSGERQKCRKSSFEAARKGKVCSLDRRRECGKKEAKVERQNYRKSKQ